MPSSQSPSPNADKPIVLDVVKVYRVGTMKMGADNIERLQFETVDYEQWRAYLDNRSDWRSCRPPQWVRAARAVLRWFRRA